MTRSSVLCALLSTSACTIYTLPSLDGDDGTGATTTDVADTDAAPTTSGPADTGAPTTDGPVDGSCDFNGDIQPLFDAHCVGCHGAQAQAGLDLRDGAAHAALVGVASSEVPTTPRVAPGDPSASYLAQKLGPDPAVGETMPLGGSLPADRVALISAWIAAGASATDSFACAGGSDSPIGEITIEGDALVVPVGDIAQLGATVTDVHGEPLPSAALTWTSSAELTLFADATGAVLGVSPGVVQLTASADGVTSQPIEIEVVANTPPPASFAAVLELTRARCGVPGCHVDGVEPGDLRFDRDDADVWDELLEDSDEVDGLARVAPGAPTDSYLVRKLVQRSPAVGVQMPIGAAPIDAASAQRIVRWILAGAPAT